MTKKDAGERFQDGPVRPRRVAVLILGYNDRRWLDRCLDSVLETRDDDFRVYFIDNASVDGSADHVRAVYPSVTVVTNSCNLGFAAGNNRGLEVAANEGAEYFVLLNSDTWVEADWLREMRAVFEAGPMIGAVTAMIKNYDDDRFDRNFMQILESTPGFVQDAWDGRIAPWYETSTGSGAALMLRRSFLQSVGVIDPVFFMYYEEIDLLRRGRFHGYKAAFSTRGVIHHYNRLETPTAYSPAKIRFERGFMIYTLKDQFSPLGKCIVKCLLEVVSRPVGAALRGEWRRLAQLLRAGGEVVFKSPWILWRRYLEMYSPDRLPEMVWLRRGGGGRDA